MSRCVQAVPADAMHHVQFGDELLDPARPSVIQMDWTFGSVKHDESQELKVMGMVKGDKHFVSVEMERTFSYALVCSNVCASDRP